MPGMFFSPQRFHTQTQNHRQGTACPPRTLPPAADRCRVRYPQHWGPFALMAASALPHAPFSIALHSMIGVSERTRDVLRTLDVFFILTCGGEGFRCAACIHGQQADPRCAEHSMCCTLQWDPSAACLAVQSYGTVSFRPLNRDEERLRVLMA
jgi:hypothetical protein